MIRAALALGKNADTDTDESVVSTSSALHLHHVHDKFGGLPVCIQNAPGQLLHKTLSQKFCQKLLLCMWVLHVTFVLILNLVCFVLPPLARVSRAALHTCHLGHLTQLQSQRPCALCASVQGLISPVYGSANSQPPYECSLGVGVLPWVFAAVRHCCVLLRWAQEPDVWLATLNSA
jgi:hypothetical protein